MIKLDLTYYPVVNFAFQRNHVPIIKKLIVVNETQQDIYNVKIKVSFLSEVSAGCENMIDIITQGTVLEVNKLLLNLSPQYLLELTERADDEIVITICDDEKVLVTEKYPIAILPFDYWAGVSILPEMLASFVTPNHPAISNIMCRASSFLEKWTGSPSLDEYQSRNPDRVKKQMAAIYEAIAEQNIVYCAPPASYELSGQRIRMCDSILSLKLGTCLDMALLYASCLEAVGINSLLIIIKGHAFAGGWLVDDTFADSANDDMSLLTKRTAVGINEIAVVETTCMNAGKNINFDIAVKAAEDHLINDADFVLSVDVKRCRFVSIHPLPQRISGTNALKIIEPTPTIRTNNKPVDISQDTRIIDVSQVDVTKQRLWERKLLDLTLRNNLLNIRLTKSILQIISANINLLEDALSDGQEFAILPKPCDWNNGLMDSGMYQAVNQTDPIIDLVKQELTQKRLHSYLGETELSHSLTGLYRSSRSSMEENGANTLYLALGLLKWYETSSSERPRYAPILLLPVEIVRKSAARGYVIRSREEETMMNITLLEMLRQDFGVNIGGLEILPKDDSGVDVQLVFNTIRKGIMNQRHWNVEEQAILGIFSFNKFIMWNDIHNNADKLCQNNIVKSLISGMIEWKVAEEDDSFDLDKDFKPSDISLPISADSFQMEAVCSSAKGNSFILHGPPGTGKSQTITNIIGNALYSGKKVLFVAEKMAALSVVQKRLADIGLAPFCLELHSNKSKKSAVLEQLKTATEIVKKTLPEDFASESERLFALRFELNNYVELLHTQLPAGFSLYEALYRYKSINDNGSEFELSNTIAAELTAEKFREWRDIVGQMQVVSDVCGTIANHPLREFDVYSYSQSIKNELKESLEKQIKLLNDLKSATNNFLNLLGIECCDKFSFYKNLYELAQLLIDSKHLPSELLKSNKLKDIILQIQEIIPHGVERDKIKNKLLAEFSKSILDIDADKLLVDWNLSQNKWFLLKYFSQNKILKILRGYSLNGQLPTEEIPKILNFMISYKNEKEFIADKSGYYVDLLGGLWEKWGVLSDSCTALLSVSDTIISLVRDMAESSKIRKNLAEKLSDGIDTFLSLHKDKILAYIHNFEELSEINENIISKTKISFDSNNWVDDNITRSERWLVNIDSLRDWCNWNDIKRKANENGLGLFVDYITQNETTQLVVVFDKAIYRSIINYTIDSQPVLAKFNGKLFEDKIRKFKELTTQFEKLTREELFAKLASNIPSFVKEASQSSEVGVLQRNIRNNGRGTSIRKLFDTIPTLLTRINPCMLMSPMSVAQYIDAENIKFDLVIFDEASQMPTCEAVGAIARGKNLIVVGDPKQMPPTNFFSSNSVDEDNIDKEDLESILDDCLALSMPSKHLLWHYRSKHESLIAFSNSQYYENKLLTFPSPDDIKSKVTYQLVAGFYDKGKSRQNRAEGEAVVNEILNRLADNELSKRSIGVVTFSSVQQTLIDDLLTEAFSKNPELESIALDSAEPIFVKNLENVQGDERDVILFSVGYGPDKDGKVSLNFGPLNREGGWRRLNVAVSRARYEMKVFSTLRADQINLSRTSAEGVAGLKAFLEYAEKGKNAMIASANTNKHNGKTLVDIIADKIKEKGYEVHTNVGCSGYRVDIGVVNANKKSEYILGILCDGEIYRTAKTVRDREIIQQDVLHLLGWNIHRVWTMDWIENEDKVIADIIAAIKETPAISIAEESIVVSELVIVNESLKEDYILPNEKRALISNYKIEYTVTNLEICGISADEFISPQWENLVMEQISKVMVCEAPISRDQLCRRVLSMWGISRIGSRIDEHFSRIFSRMNLKQTGFDKGYFFWKEEQNPLEYMNYRASMVTASDIAPEEISVAVKEVLEAQISLSREDLIRETARLFSYARLGKIVESSMQRGINKAIERGFAIEENERIILK